MSELSLSVRVDAGCLEHNNRTFFAKNVHSENTPNNIIYKQEDIKSIYEKEFATALKKYNAKQTRKDRCIENYLEHIKRSKQEKPFYEAIIQYGNMNDSKVGTPGGDIAKNMLDEYMQTFQKRNPNLVVFNAVMHLDEETPHLHINFVPVCHNQKRGLETRVSLKLAYAEMGITPKSQSSTERQQWAVVEKSILKSIAKKYNIDIAKKNIKRPHLTVDEYKAAAREVDRINEQVKILAEKSNLDPAEIKKTDLEMLISQNKLLRKQLEEKNIQVSELENKINADYRYIKISDEQKIGYVSATLKRKGVGIVDDIDGIHIPEWAVGIAKEISEKYKPVQLTWRKELALTIDRLIYVSSSIDSLMKLLEEKGYEIHRGKYISIKPHDADRAVRTKTLGEEYTEENLSKRISQKDLLLKKTDDKIKTTSGIEQEYYITVRKTIMLIYGYKKTPKKQNAARFYSVSNDSQINDLSQQIAIINKDKITSLSDLQSRIERLSNSILEIRQSVNDITKLQTNLRDVIAKAQFYFANEKSKLTGSDLLKFSVAKETIEKYDMKSAAEIETLNKQYQENIVAIAQLNQKAPLLQKQQSELLKIEETYQSIAGNTYISKFIEKEPDHIKKNTTKE